MTNSSPDVNVQIIGIPKTIKHRYSSCSNGCVGIHKFSHRIVIVNTPEKFLLVRCHKQGKSPHGPWWGIIMSITKVARKILLVVPKCDMVGPLRPLFLQLGIYIKYHTRYMIQDLKHIRTMNIIKTPIHVAQGEFL